MASHSEQKQPDIIDKVVEFLYEKLPKQEAALIEKFARAYYASASLEDLDKVGVIDLYGALISHWRFLNHRKPKETKVHVYNPQFEQHGWQSTHTVVEIIQEDMPFLLDSVRMELNRRGLTAHLILHLGNFQVKRNKQGEITEILDKKDISVKAISEAPLLFEIDRQSDVNILHEIKESIESVLKDVRLCVKDWEAMCAKMSAVIKELPLNGGETKQETEEKIAFLKWLCENNFTFLGYCQFFNDGEGWELTEGSSLGLLKKGIKGYFDNYKNLPKDAKDLVKSSEKLIIGKTNQPSTVHRPAHPDLIAIKCFDEAGNVIGAHCFIGLYTAAAYNRSTLSIPLLRHKVKKILDKSAFSDTSHDGKTLVNIIETMPRDDMFQGTFEDLFDISIGILRMQERRRIKLFVRHDVFGHYYSCQVFVPRELFNSQVRETIQSILENAMQGQVVSFNTRFSESVLARIHFIVQVDPREKVAFNIQEIENSIIEAARTWKDNLSDALADHYGEEEGNRLAQRYCNAFPAGYQDTFIARTAVYDIAHIESLSEKNILAMSFYRPLEEPEGTIRFKLYHEESAIPLSDVVPMLENMGLRIINERPHEIKISEKKVAYINDFGMLHESVQDLNVDEVKDIFQDAFYNVWCGNAENDGFNRLVLSSGLNWHEVSMLRAYAKYLWQIGFTFSQNYVEDTLARNPIVASELVELFVLRFDPTIPQESKNVRINELRLKIKADLEEVKNLDEDRILSRYVDIIMATIRTNYFQKTVEGEYKTYLSFKIDSSAVPEMPLPKPMCEIFVYSPSIEGIHLRGAKVARGGIRWSDRKEDFRTEVLGLMKAQQVKNAVIVPLGAKGGFVCKSLPEHGDREKIMEEVILSYKTFIRALLDLTDNIINDTVVPPRDLVRYDGDDPYLVVAADKGTASFSDIANGISQEYNFWLRDAFASGGSMGYDHKKMGITARGAWESVKRHFRELGLDTQTQTFTVVGIGDMAGDVFGNGMLLSRQIKLLAAFNHMHIFLDPNPDPEASFLERERLFKLPRSTWKDYDESLISSGGGIYERSAKSITLTPEVKDWLRLDQDKVVPNELIRAILKSNVDLLWNGGIGTYVKASYEHNSEVGDRANDGLRVNGSDLRCLVIAEGGNLGFTQLGRVEYALRGGRINTDAIDNSAGVDCSDHEVNIKILLNEVVANGDLTQKQRNELLEEMTDEVARLVLKNNYAQTGALSLALLNPDKNIEMYKRLMSYLEQNANLNKKIEYLPTSEELQRRKQDKKGLTRPELSVLFAYSKTLLKQLLLASDLPEDPYIANIIETAFPKVLVKDYTKELYQHRLKREIIVMQVANFTINDMGLNFINRLIDETGATAPEIIRCYMVSNEIFDVQTMRNEIDALNFKVESKVQLSLLHELNRLTRRSTRWFLRQNRGGINISESISNFQDGVRMVKAELLTHLKGESKGQVESIALNYMKQSVPESLAYDVASLFFLSAALDIVESATTYQLPIKEVLSTYFTLGAKLDIGWVKEEIKQHPVTSHWDALARAAFRDDLDRQQRSLAVAVLKMHEDMETTIDVDEKIDAWMESHRVLVARWNQMIAELKAQSNRDFTMFSVAIRELLDLAHASQISMICNKY